ncbi:hypothetical protein Tco_0493378 [Tanacetum coccineum]
MFPVKCMYFHIPGKELSNGLKEIKNDVDISEFIALDVCKMEDITGFICDHNENSTAGNFSEGSVKEIPIVKGEWPHKKWKGEGVKIGSPSKILKGMDVEIDSPKKKGKGVQADSPEKKDNGMARGKPIIIMLEKIRVYLMQRLYSMNKLASNVVDNITPSIRKEIEILKESQRYWLTYSCGSNLYKVKKTDESIGFNLKTMTCTCKW